MFITKETNKTKQIVAFCFDAFFILMQPRSLLCLEDKFVELTTYICPGSGKANIKSISIIGSAFPKQLVSKYISKRSLSFFGHIAIFGNIQVVDIKTSI